MSECKSNLLEFSVRLTLHQQKFHRLPETSGSAFLAEMARGGGHRDEHLDEHFVALDHLQRRLATFPASGSEIVVADATAHDCRGRPCLNVLRANGMIETLGCDDPRIASALDPAGNLVVGPESPLPELRALAPR